MTSKSKDATSTQLMEYRMKLRKLRSRRDMHVIQLYNEVRWQYLNLLEKQEIYWKQKAKNFWLRESDRNTRFFHKHASSRRQNNVVHKIKDANGEWRETVEEVQGVIEDYFMSLFQSMSLDGRLSERDIVQRVSETENIALLSDVTADEVKEALFSMHPDKSPGPYGLNPAFF